MLGQSFLTQFVIVKDFVQHQNEIVSHFDEEYIVLCKITLYNPLHGGDTVYYNGIQQRTCQTLKIWGDILI